MANPVVIIDYQKCLPPKCKNGICVATEACPNNVLRQESANEIPFSHPSRFCRGCAKCAQACPRGAIKAE